MKIHNIHTTNYKYKSIEGISAQDYDFICRHHGKFIRIFISNYPTYLEHNKYSIGIYELPPKRYLYKVSTLCNKQATNKRLTHIICKFIFNNIKLE